MQTTNIRPRASVAEIDDMIRDLTYHEDPDQMLLISETEDGFLVMSVTWDTAGEGKTFRDALYTYGKRVYDPDWDEDNKLDWTK